MCQRMGNLREPVLSFCHVGSRYPTHAVRLGTSVFLHRVLLKADTLSHPPDLTPCWCHQGSCQAPYFSVPPSVVTQCLRTQPKVLPDHSRPHDPSYTLDKDAHSSSEIIIGVQIMCIFVVRVPLCDAWLCAANLLV